MDGVDEIALGGWEGPRAALHGTLGAEQAETGAAAALRDIIANPDGIPTLPESGWSLLHEDKEHAVFAVPEAPGSDGWDVVHIERQGNIWAYHSSTHGAVPGRTTAQRGAGLQLVWPDKEIVRRHGDPWALQVLLRNDRPEPWETDEGEYQPIAEVIDLASGQPLGGGSVYVVGVGRSYRLEPGDSVSLHVIVEIDVEETLGRGRYGVVAQLWQLGLRSDQAVLHLI